MWLLRWTYRNGEVRYLTKQEGRFYWEQNPAKATPFNTEDDALDFQDEYVAEGNPVDTVTMQEALDAYRKG